MAALISGNMGSHSRARRISASRLIQPAPVSKAAAVERVPVWVTSVQFDRAQEFALHAIPVPIEQFLLDETWRNAGVPHRRMRHWGQDSLY